jgi:hypothetical protein
MSRSKSLKFLFDLPIEEINQADGLFSKKNIGSVRIQGRGIISPNVPEDMPLDLAEGKPLRVEIFSATYENIDVLPLLKAFPEGAGLIKLFTDAGDKTARQIYASKLK